MAWTSPATPVAGTAITVAFYSTNIRDNLSWLRQNTGGGFDPTGSGQILRSTGVAATEWTSSPTIAGNVTITGFATIGTTLAVGGNLTMNGAAAVVGGDLTLSSTRLLVFAAEQNEKIRLDGVTHGIGTAANTVFIRAPTTVEFRDSGGTQRISMALSASPSMTIGGNTVATLNSANFTALQLGGITVARPATGTYAGDGGTSGRQITVGFVPKLVHLWSQTSGSTMYIIMHDGGSIRLHNSGNPEYTTEVKLHGTDGFIVGAGAQHRGNDVAEAYRWVAMI